MLSGKTEVDVKTLEHIPEFKALTEKLEKSDSDL